MVFSSIVFLYIFLPLMLLLYFIVPSKLKNAIMILASLVFFAWGENPLYFYYASASCYGFYMWQANYQISK